MTERDAETFCALWMGMQALYGEGGDAVEASLAFAALKDQTLADIRQAVVALCREMRHRPPTPADVLAWLREREAAPLRRPSVEEAWAMALRAMDETETVVWCDEVAAAWGEAKVLWPGDKVGARRLFEDVYRRLCRQAVEAGERPRWTVSAGTDRARRAEVVLEAVRDGRLPRVPRAFEADVRETFGELPGPREVLEELFGPEGADRVLGRPPRPREAARRGEASGAGAGDGGERRGEAGTIGGIPAEEYRQRLVDWLLGRTLMLPPPQGGGGRRGGPGPKRPMPGEGWDGDEAVSARRAQGGGDGGA